MSESQTPGTVPQLPENSTGIRNKSEQQPVSKSKQKQPTKSQSADDFMQMFREVYKMVEKGVDSVKHDDKQERRFRNNLSEEKKDEFYNLYDRGLKNSTIKNKPNIVANIFVTNNINRDYLGYTDTEVGVAISEHESENNPKRAERWRGATLKEKTQRGYNYLWHARWDLKISLVTKEMDDGRIVWFLAESSKDCDDELRRNGNVAGIFIDSFDKKRKAQEAMEKEEKAKQKEMESEQIILDTEGHEVSE